MTTIPPRVVDALAGAYRLERELGQGGMATVYLAEDLKHHRRVALKVLRPELAAALGPDRFAREIEIAARLQHPHILGVFDSGDAGGNLWFTMPYVDGESLRARLARERRLPVHVAVRIATEAARALDYAHRHGVVHRDIKPENLLLTAEGDTLVADFGIARALAVTDSRLTETGMAVGTPAYMSPEQAAGDRTVDARTDVYSLGAVLFEMLAGEPPFTGATAQAVIAKRFSGAVPSVRQVRTSVPENVEHAVTRALAPVAADRWATAAEFARALTATASDSLATPAVPAPLATALDSLPPVAARPRPAVTRRRGLPTALAFVLGLAVTASMGMLVWQRNHRATEPSAGGPQRVAVLPFENIGAPEDEYFADGITDEVRGKLAALPSLQVTASNSSSQYKKTTASPQQIGQELGVQYLLVGKVRWEGGTGAERRVRVSPELVQVATGSTRWQQPFDAPLTDVFQVQADIAGRVAEALNVVLDASERRSLAARPTENLDAYDAFLKGDAASEHLSTLEGPKLQRAAGFYQRAIELDSTFAQAWGRLARTQALIYVAVTPTPATAAATKRAVDRAVALAPDAVETQLALGDFYNNVLNDQARSLAAYEAGLRRMPDNADLLAAATIPEQILGRWESSLARLQRATVLDPRSVWIIRNYAFALLTLRRYGEARAVCDRGRALAPDNLPLIETAITISLTQGDLAGARAVLQRAPPTVAPEALAAYFALFGDRYWVLDEPQQRLLLRLGPEYYGGDRGNWGLVLAQVHHLHGDPALSRIYADSARLAYEAQLRETPQDAQRHVLLGLSFAYLGRFADAEWEIRQGLAISNGRSDTPYYEHQLVRTYMLAGKPEKALDHLEPLLSAAYDLTPALLRIDPNFAPLRDHPRFQRLIGSPPMTAPSAEDRR